MRAACDRVRHYAVEPEDCKHQRERCENTYNDSTETRRGCGVSDNFAHCADVEDWHVRGKFAERIADHLHKSAGIRRCADYKREAAPIRRQVINRARILAQAGVFNVSYDSNDFSRWFLRARFLQHYRLTERIFPRPKRVRHCSANDDNTRMVLGIGFGKRAAFENRDAHGVEIISADRLPVRELESLTAEINKKTTTGFASERQFVDCSDRNH